MNSNIQVMLKPIDYEQFPKCSVGCRQKAHGLSDSQVVRQILGYNY